MSTGAESQPVPGRPGDGSRSLGGRGDTSGAPPAAPWRGSFPDWPPRSRSGATQRTCTMGPSFGSASPPNRWAATVTSRPRPGGASVGGGRLSPRSTSASAPGSASNDVRAARTSGGSAPGRLALMATVSRRLRAVRITSTKRASHPEPPACSARSHTPSQPSINNRRGVGLPCSSHQISLVSQEVVLFNDTIAGNIAYGSCRNATRTDIEAAARAACGS